MTLAISNDRLAMHYQLSISHAAAAGFNRKLPIANASRIANRQSLIAGLESL